MDVVKRVEDFLITYQYRVRYEKCSTPSMVRHPFRRLVSGYSEKLERDWGSVVVGVDVTPATVELRTEVLRINGITQSQ